MNWRYLRPGTEEWKDTESFITSLVILVVGAYTAWTAWDMRATLEEEGCERFVKEFSSIGENESIRFVDPEDQRREFVPGSDSPDVREQDFSENYSVR